MKHDSTDIEGAQIGVEWSRKSMSGFNWLKMALIASKFWMWTTESQTRPDILLFTITLADPDGGDGGSRPSWIIKI